LSEISAGVSKGEAAAALIYESIIMNTKMITLGAALLAIGCFWSSQAFAQTSTTVTTTNGAFTEYVPGSETMVVRSETGTSPLRYSVTKQTTIVDETGAPVAIDRISPGSQLSIQYTGSGDRLVASRVVVRPATTATTAVTSVPVTGQETNTTTTTTRPMTHDEKHALKEEREHQKKAAKEEIEHRKDALDKAKDKLDDDDD
jgi:thiol:disulfide interchange protein